jgi:hypothetical protein
MKKIKAEDFQSTLKELEELNKVYSKCDEIIKKEG